MQQYGLWLLLTLLLVYVMGTCALGARATHIPAAGGSAVVGDVVGDAVVGSTVLGDAVVAGTVVGRGW